MSENITDTQMCIEQMIQERNFMCNKCNFNCSYESNYNQHLTTAKHKRRSNPNENPTKSDKPHLCKNCGKGYNHKSTLCKHKHTCKGNVKQNNIIVKPDVVENPDNNSKESIILALIAQNKELMNLITSQHQEQSKTMQEQLKTMREMVAKVGDNNTINNNNNKENLLIKI